MCLNIATPNNHHFTLGTNGKVVVLGVPILKHFRVYVLETVFYILRVSLMIGPALDVQILINWTSMNHIMTSENPICSQLNG